MKMNQSGSTPISESQFEAWNKDKTRRINQHDSKRYPSSKPCPYCNGSGWRYVDWDAGRMEPCSCREGIRIAGNQKQAGRSASIASYTLSDYQAEQEWQEKLLRAACAYARNPKGFLYLDGQPGAGKTHLAAGVFNHLLKNGVVGIYRDWSTLTAELKAVQNTTDYIRLMDNLKGCAVLFLDDFLHAPKKQPTSGDLKLAFEIINARYEDGKKPTIITSNLTPDDIDKFDESLSGKIAESAGEYLLSIARDPNKNYRNRKAVHV